MVIATVLKLMDTNPLKPNPSAKELNTMQFIMHNNIVHNMLYGINIVPQQIFHCSQPLSFQQVSLYSICYDYH